MIDVTVKTLDSQNHVFNVDETITVKQFKEIISPTITIPVDQQRLIFRGRVLQDDKKISEYNIASNVVHVVQRPSNQNNTANDEPSRPGSRLGDGGHGGILFAADDGAAGGGRNAIIMGAIGLPTLEMEGIPSDEVGNQLLIRRSGAAVRLLVGNQMLNRASTLLQQLEDEDVTAAASGPGSSSSPELEQNSMDSLSNNDMQMEIDDDPVSIERMISQVVNVSSAAVAALAQNRPVQPQPTGNLGPNNATTGSSAGAATFNVREGSITNESQSSVPSSENRQGNQQQQQQHRSPARHPDSPRLRELATALQDLLALQDRLNPFLRFLQSALRENMLYSEEGESRSTQFVFDTVSSILHMLGHSLHAFSDIVCDFSIAPEDRRLGASSSLLVESTVVHATIPVPAAAMLAAGVNAGMAAGSNNNNPPISFSMTNPGIGMGMGLQSSQVWRNPNIPGSNSSTTPSQPQANNTTTGSSNTGSPAASTQGPVPSMQIPAALNFQGGRLPAGLQNLGALLGMGGPGMVNMNIFGPGGPIQGGVPLVNMQSNNNTVNVGAQQQPPNNAAPTGAPPSTDSSSNNIPRTEPQQGQPRQSNTTSGTENNNNGGMFQNRLQLRRDNRPQFDVLLPCHTHHLRGQSQSNRTRPAEFRRFVNLEGSGSSTLANAASNEGEAVEIIMDFIRHSRVLDLFQPVVKDVLLNYLMRGRDPKNEAHLRTCAKSLAKKLLPFFEKFLSTVAGMNECVDISATFTNILTTYVVNLMQGVLGQIPGGDGQLKSHLFKSTSELQKQLICALKACYPSQANVGLIFVNYLMDQWLGGMSIIFKAQVRQKLVDHLNELEQKCNRENSTNSYGQIAGVVYKEVPLPVSSNSIASTPSGSQAAASSSVSSRCAASFNSGSVQAGPEASSSDVSPSVNNLSPTAKSKTDDVDIDEVLQLPPSMNQGSSGSLPGAQRRNVPMQGASNQTDSISSLLQSLPSEWSDTVQQDIRRQVEMPSQPAFSPGYNTLFPRKH